MAHLVANVRPWCSRLRSNPFVNQRECFCLSLVLPDSNPWLVNRQPLLTVLEVPRKPVTEYPERVLEVHPCQRPSENVREAELCINVCSKMQKHLSAVQMILLNRKHQWRQVAEFEIRICLVPQKHFQRFRIALVDRDPQRGLKANLVVMKLLE